MKKIELVNSSNNTKCFTCGGEIHINELNAIVLTREITYTYCKICALDLCMKNLRLLQSKVIKLQNAIKNEPLPNQLRFDFKTEKEDKDEKF